MSSINCIGCEHQKLAADVLTIVHRVTWLHDTHLALVEIAAAQ